MTFEFKPEEIEVLVKDYRLMIEPSEERQFSLPAIDLLDKLKSLEYLDKVSSIFESTSLLATASLFAKRYSFLIIASSLYAMSRFDKGLDYSIENCHIESNYQGKAWLPKVRLTDWQVTQPAEGNRDEWRDQTIHNLFAGNIAKAWHALSESAAISKAILWENTAIYVYYLYENKYAETADSAEKSRIQADYEYLITKAPGYLFGETKNPLAKFDSPKVTTLASETPLRIRKTCCYYYQVADDPEDYCPTCPKIKHKVVISV